MASNETETQQVISNLRACLLSAKGGIPITSLERDYRVLIGQRIPYSKLGFDTLEKFLKSIPDVSMSRTRTGETILDAIPSKSTKHLADLVAKQKSAPKKIRTSRSYPQRRTAASQWRPPPSSSWRNSSGPSSYGKRSPLSVTVNNSYKSNQYDRGDRMVKVVSEPRSPISSKGTSSMTSLAHRSSQRVFELPPRFLKLSSQEGNNNRVQSQPLPSGTPSQPQSPTLSVEWDSPASSRLHSPLESPQVPSPCVSSQPQSPGGPGPRSSEIPSWPQSAEATPLSPRSVDTPLRSPLIRARPPLGVMPPRPLLMGVSARLQSPSQIVLNGDLQSVTATSLDSNTTGVPSHKRNKFTTSYPVLQSRLRNKRNPQVPSVIQVEEKDLETLSRSASQDYSSELQRISRLMGWGVPSFKLVPRVPKGEPVMYGCIVKVGEHSYNSYPDEHTIPAEVLQLAAKIALDDLSRIYDTVGGNNRLTETADKNVIMSRVAELVANYPNGVWSTQIPIDYKEKYTEALPGEWLKLMGGCSLITLDYVAGNRIIISPNEPSAENPISLSPAIKVEPGPLVFPECDLWDIYVTYATSTAEVWIRLIGDNYSVLYENMATDMEMFYMESNNIALEPEVGSFYAIQQDDCWHRVQLETLEGQGALVFFIDHGDEDAFPVELLHVLEPRFAHLPAQAIRCSLSGLEDFVEDPNASRHLVEIIGMTFIADVVSRGNDEDPVVRLILFDTSYEDDVNLNQLLAEKISQEVNAPQLPQVGEIAEVYISHVTDTGDLFVQIQSDCYNYLERLMRQLTEDALTAENVQRALNHHNDPSKLYLGRYPEDMKYYRARIIETHDPNEVKVLFVDYGNTEIISSSELLMLKVLSETLDEFPHQAIKVSLHNLAPESFSPRLVARVRGLIPDNEPVLVKVIEPACNGRLPLVEIFKRIDENNQLVSINNTLAFDPEYVKPTPKIQTTVESNVRGKNMLERLRSLNAERMTSPDHSAPSPSPTSRMSPQIFGLEDGQGDFLPRGLESPEIPEVGKFFDVHVTMAANPSNFTVQPYKERLRRERMMEAMQEFYKTWPCPIRPPETAIEGGLYAALHNDGNFYRVCVSNVMGGNIVSVHFCDYGDVAVLTEDKLQPLDKQFRKLPYQAIKAKLSGIQPSHSDWSVEDCLMFQERVVEHQFVSIIVERGPDLLNPSDTCLGLQLIDTTGERDVNIDQLLVDEERAVYIQ